MRKIIAIILLCLNGTVCGVLNGTVGGMVGGVMNSIVSGAMSGMMSARAEDVVYLTTEEFRSRVFDYSTQKDWHYQGSKPCVIDFYATWCGPCKRLAPIMDELSQQYCDQVVFYKVDIEKERELAYLFGISSIPQVLYIPVTGQPVLSKGLAPKEEIIRIIDSVLLGK